MEILDYEDDISGLAVDTMLTWKCNLRCTKCCVPKSGPEVSAEEFAALFDKLRDIGLSRIVLTGGEPLVRDDVVDIARAAKERGFKIYLSTNGVLLSEKWESLAPYISWISLSLDGSSEDKNEAFIGRGGDLQFRKIMEFLQRYNGLEKQTANVKLATVITKSNKDDLLQLGRVIFEEQQGYRPDVWRLYQFSDQFSDESDVGHEYVTENSVTAEEAEVVITQLRAAFPHVEISYRPAESRDESFIFISPDLTLTYPSGKKYITFGDTKEMDVPEIRDAILGVRHIWTKIIKNREVYS